jgi:hypothetical protein
MRKTVRFHTGARVVRVSYDPDEDHATAAEEPFVGAVAPAKPRGVLGSVLIVAAGGFIAMMANRAVKRWRAERAA